jgi:hypothetical protein
MTGLVLFILIMGVLLCGILLGALLTKMNDAAIAREEEARRISLDDRVSLTEAGYRGLGTPPPAPPDEAATDAMEAKARETRAERLREVRRENPGAFQPVVTNPDDPTDIVL